ncbi:MAG: rod shape-determining protein MreC [Endomicrobium sp.]|jgi:rod shape-determining protein MreC|nr:rod shape-determining protein MreC [Endomicrobium sp.]
MRDGKEPRYTNIVFFVLLITGFVFILIRLTPPVRLIKNFIYYAAYPNVSAANQIFQTAGDFAQNIKSMVYVRQENIFYKQKNQELVDKLRNYNEMKEQYDNLAHLLAVEKIKGSKSVFAKITAREPSEWYQWLIINKGSAAGLYDGLPVAVVTDGGRLCAAGRIVETNSFSSKIALITNILSSTPVRIKGKNISCLAEGFNSNLIKISYIASNENISVGDEIEISPLSSAFPSGMPVGKIISVSSAQSTDFKTAVAEVFFESDALYEAVILVPQDENNSGQNK